MKNLVRAAAALGAIAVAGSASAAPIITSVSVQGSATKFVWSTAPTRLQDTLFIAHGSGAGVNAVVNPTNNFGGGTGLGTPDPDNSGDFVFTLYGDGYPAQGTTSGRITSFPNSDASYTISVTLKDGSKTGTLVGTYTPTGNLFASTSTFRGSSAIYNLDAFTWNRQLQNYVGTRSTDSATDVAGSKRDYRGDLMLGASAVPEPGSWALMIVGFGLVGGALRTRRRPVAAVA